MNRVRKKILNLILLLIAGKTLKYTSQAKIVKDARLHSISTFYVGNKNNEKNAEILGK